MRNLIIILFLIPLLIMFVTDSTKAQQNEVQIVNLKSGENDDSFSYIRREFKKRNPGYDMKYMREVRRVNTGDYVRVLFVQEIGGVTNQDVSARAVVTGNSDTEKKSETIVGDILVLRPGEKVQFDSKMGLLVFRVPVKPEQELPSFIRPDWDPNITDVPGGCATEIDAYRRILLTWKKEVGNYIYHALNAHRVRIYDSFSHYHPTEGGFDEFYLVQMVKPGARLITSEKVERITRPGEVKKSEIEGLMDEYELKVGDLVYLPRGIMHRGLDGVLAQVITVPGFIPGSEIGVDHHLRAINERLNLQGEEKLPYNEEHSHEAVIR